MQINKLILSKVIEPNFSGVGKWESKSMHNVLLSLTRARPRDLVKLFRGAAKKAQESNNLIITSSNLRDYFEAYSQDRLQDIINEFRSELPEVQRFIFAMRPTRKERLASHSYQFATDRLSSKISSVLSTLPLTFTSGRRVTPRSMIQFLYKVDFITARMEKNGRIERKYFDESAFWRTRSPSLDLDGRYNPAYRWALQPQDVQEVLKSLLEEI